MRARAALIIGLALALLNPVVAKADEASRGAVDGTETRAFDALAIDAAAKDLEIGLRLTGAADDAVLVLSVLDETSGGVLLVLSARGSGDPHQALQDFCECLTVERPPASGGLLRLRLRPAPARTRVLIASRQVDVEATVRGELRRTPVGAEGYETDAAGKPVLWQQGDIDARATATGRRALAVATVPCGDVALGSTQLLRNDAPVTTLDCSAAAPQRQSLFADATESPARWQMRGQAVGTRSSGLPLVVVEH